MKKALKFKNKKFQSGGVVGGGFSTISLTPNIQVSPSVFTTFKVYETAQLPVIDRSQFKPQIDLDKLKGHRNEVAEIYRRKEALDRELASLSDLDILGNTERFRVIMSQYNQLLSPRIINELAVSKEYSERAYSAAEKKGIMGEINVKDGKFIMKSGDGKVAEVPLNSVDAYIQNGFQFMTTGELFHERDTNENLAFSYQVDHRLSYGVSADELRKRFRDQLVVGSNEQGSKGESYRLVKKVIDDIGTEDVFEESYGGGRRVKDNYKQLEFALNNIISSMSQEERDTLIGLVTRRLVNSNIPVTSENVANEMYAYLLSLKESKKEFSDVSEGFTRLGTRITGSASGSGSGSQSKVEIGPAAMALMGMGTTDNRTIMRGNTKIDLRGVVLPVKEDLVKGSGENERFVTLSETSKLRHAVNIHNIRLFNGAKVGANEFVIDPEWQPIVTFAYRGRNGEYLINNEEARKANAEFEAATKEFLARNPSPTTKEFEEFKENMANKLLRNYNVEQVVIMNGWVPITDERVRNMKADVDYIKVHRDENRQVQKAFESKSTDQNNFWWFNPEYMKTQVIMPAAPMSVVRTMVDEDKVYTKATALEDQGSLAVMEQQQVSSGRNFPGVGIEIFGK
ncbi:MAG: hypothetical protein NZZ41_01285 [Candidatus Dojkabacteria bacterium]|nr:hypothetical protein [Candidatus Dojkabacteria bacterium]